MIVENINSRYSHQLYSLHENSNEIRAYFNNLIKVSINNNNNNNGHQNEKIYNYEELAQKIAVLTNNSNNYNNIVSMLKTDEALKVIVALLFKGFGWHNEIYETFNISSKLYVERTLRTLQSLKLLIKEKGVKLNPIFYEALLKTKSHHIRKSLHQSELLFINEEYIEFCSLVKDLFEFKARTSSTFRFSLKTIIEDSEHFIKQLNWIIEDELEVNLRTHKTEDGIIYETETIKSKNFQKNLNAAMAEVKVEQLEAKEQNNLLSSSEKSKLALVRKTSNPLTILNSNSNIDNNKKDKKSIILYNGKQINSKNFNEIQNEFKEFDKVKTIIGNLELATEKSIFDGGVFLSNKALQEFQPKSEEQKVEDLFSSLGGFVQ